MVNKVKQRQVKNLSKKEQLIILAVITLALSIGVFGPILAKFSDRLRTRKRLKKELQVLKEKTALLNGIEPILIDDRVKKMEIVFPSKKPIVQLMSTLATLSQQRKLNFGGVSLNPGSLKKATTTKNKTKSESDSSTGLQDLTFGFAIEGSFGDVLGFLKDLENVAPLMKIDQVSLSIKTNPLFETENTQVQADIKVSAFYQPPPKTLGAISSPVKLLSKKDETILNKLINFKTFEVVVPVARTGKKDLFE